MQSLADPVARTISVAELVSFVQDYQIPVRLTKLVFQFGCIIVGEDDDRFLRQRCWNALSFHLPVGFCIQDDCRQVELGREFCSPLLTDSGRADDNELPLTFSPFLTQDDSGLDRFAQPHLVRQNNALSQWRLQRKHCRLYLMRIEIHGRIEQRHRELIFRSWWSQLR
ncbi:hypothetical protein D3C87_1466360 [compost metagenome]